MSVSSDELDLNANSNNGRHTFHIKCDETNDEFTMIGRPCELSAFSFVPAHRKHETPPRTIYNYKKTEEEKVAKRTDYDCLFQVGYDFNNKTHRCDRKHAKLRGLDTWSEEIQKQVPSRFSSEYGKKTVVIDQVDPTLKYRYDLERQIDVPERNHVRVDKKAEFYSRNGINDLSRQRGV